MSIPFSSTIAILGGAGKAGRAVVLAALAAGYRVRVLLRHPALFTIQHEHLTILLGDARNPEALRQLLVGCAGLLSTLGNPKGEQTPIISLVTNLLISELRNANIRRYVTVTSLYTTAVEQLDAATQQAIDYMAAHYPQFMADRQRELDLLAASELDWTCVRLPYLLETPAVGTVKTRLDYLPGPTITVTDLAQFLVSQLTGNAYIRHAPFVANG